ncbi:uncharacterized protein LOC131439618 [Malaya genurostris]|uniref:uncharacterized protein LOC131439618 n=1 Tax=Malaya genurostris TaxID=325434 RepID=UPI0026F3A023|nr:uncharacterized protein LOC131439618 [Malaya genurostris]
MRFVIVVYLVAVGFLGPFCPKGSEAQMTGNLFPASEFVWGTYSNAYTVCYSNTVNRHLFSLVPVSQIFSFTPTAAQLTVRYIRVWTDNYHPFYATVTTGGVGTANPTVTTVQVSSIHAGKLYANIQILCG